MRRILAVCLMLLLLSACGGGELWFYGTVLDVSEDGFWVEVPKSEKHLGDELHISWDDLEEINPGLLDAALEPGDTVSVMYDWRGDYAYLIDVHQVERFKATVTAISGNDIEVQITEDSGGMLPETFWLRVYEEQKIHPEVGDTIAGEYDPNDTQFDLARLNWYMEAS